MLAITDKVFTEYLKANKQYHLDEMLNLKRFTVSASPLSYRQTNSLDENKLLDTDRENKSAWRKFGYKELVYFHIVFVLREFGIKNEQLMPLWESFFKEPVGERNIDLTNKTDAEVAIGCAWGGVEMTLIVDSKGKVVYADPFNMILALASEPQIKITLNGIVSKLNAQSNLPAMPITHSLQSVILNNLSATTIKEKEILRIIRDNEYTAIRVKKKHGEPFTVYAEKMQGDDTPTAKDIKQLLEAKGYIDISVVKRDGKIVSYKLEETIKL